MAIALGNEVINSFELYAHEIKTAKTQIKIGKYYLYINKSQGVSIYEEKGKKLIILGDIVNVFTGNSELIAKEILGDADDIKSLVELEKNYGGQYALFFLNQNGNLFVMGDATGTIPIFYAHVDDEFCCSNSAEVIAKEFKLDMSERLVAIRDATSDKKKILPGDITTYRLVYRLLPNHYICENDRKATRFVNSTCDNESITALQAANITYPLIQNIAKYYTSKYKVYCPITCGRDSRIVIAILSNISKEALDAYTIRHRNMDANSEQIIIPKSVCELLKFNYKVVEDEKIPVQLKTELDEYFGPNAYSKRLADISYTVVKNFGDGIALNGDIVGHIGKSTLHKTISTKYGTAKYFSKRIHNFDKKSVDVIQEWISEVLETGEKTCIYDLFSIESRLAIMMGTNNMLHNIMGHKYVNIFNSRSIIYTWTKVSRESRVNADIHTELLKLACPELVEIPYEKPNRFKKLASKSEVLFILAVNIKYYVDKIKYSLLRK